MKRPLCEYRGPFLAKLIHELKSLSRTVVANFIIPNDVWLVVVLVDVRKRGGVTDLRYIFII